MGERSPFLAAAARAKSWPLLTLQNPCSASCLSYLALTVMAKSWPFEAIAKSLWSSFGLERSGRGNVKRALKLGNINHLLVHG